MKKIFSTVASIIITIISCIILFAIYVLYMLSDPGDRRKFEIGIPYAVENTTSETINNEERLVIAKFIKDSIIGHEHNFSFDPDTRDTVSIAKDTLLDYQITKVLTNDNAKIYFINYLSAIYVLGNDSIKPETFRNTVSWCSIYLNSDKNIVKDLSYYPSGFDYEPHLKLQTNDRILEDLEKEAIQYTLYGHQYYSISLWVIKIKNSNFWDDILINKSLVSK